MAEEAKEVKKEVKLPLFDNIDDYNYLYYYVKAMNDLVSQSGSFYDTVKLQVPDIDSKIVDADGKVSFISLNKVITNEAYAYMFNLGGLSKKKKARIANMVAELGAAVGEQKRGRVPTLEDVNKVREYYVKVKTEKCESSENEYKSKYEKRKEAIKKDRKAGRSVFGAFLRSGLVIGITLIALGLFVASSWSVITAAISSTFGLTTGIGVAGVVIGIAGSRWLIERLGNALSESVERISTAMKNKSAEREKRKEAYVEFRKAKAAYKANKKVRALDLTAEKYRRYPGYAQEPSMQRTKAPVFNVSDAIPTEAFQNNIEQYTRPEPLAQAPQMGFAPEMGGMAVGNNRTSDMERTVGDTGLRYVSTVDHLANRDHQIISPDRNDQGRIDNSERYQTNEGHINLENESEIEPIVFGQPIVGPQNSQDLDSESAMERTIGDIDVDFVPPVAVSENVENHNVSESHIEPIIVNPPTNNDVPENDETQTNEPYSVEWVFGENEENNDQPFTIIDQSEPYVETYNSDVTYSGLADDAVISFDHAAIDEEENKTNNINETEEFKKLLEETYRDVFITNAKKGRLTQEEVAEKAHIVVDRIQSAMNVYEAHNGSAKYSEPIEESVLNYISEKRKTFSREVYDKAMNVDGNEKPQARPAPENVAFHTEIEQTEEEKDDALKEYIQKEFDALIEKGLTEEEAVDELIAKLIEKSKSSEKEEGERIAKYLGIDQIKAEQLDVQNQISEKERILKQWNLESQKAFNKGLMPNPPGKGFYKKTKANEDVLRDFALPNPAEATRLTKEYKLLKQRKEELRKLAEEAGRREEVEGELEVIEKMRKIVRNNINQFKNAPENEQNLAEEIKSPESNTEYIYINITHYDEGMNKVKQYKISRKDWAIIQSQYAMLQKQNLDQQRMMKALVDDESVANRILDSEGNPTDSHEVLAALAGGHINPENLKDDKYSIVSSSYRHDEVVEDAEAEKAAEEAARDHAELEKIRQRKEREASFGKIPEDSLAKALSEVVEKTTSDVLDVVVKVSEELDEATMKAREESDLVVIDQTSKDNREKDLKVLGEPIKENDLIAVLNEQIEELTNGGALNLDKYNLTEEQRQDILVALNNMELLNDQEQQESEPTLE